MNVVDVYILRQPYGLFRYNVPDCFNFSLFQPGIRILVPFGKNNRLTIGILKKKLSLTSVDLELKDIFLPLEYRFLSPELLELVDNISTKYLNIPAKIIYNLIPSPFRKVPRSLYFLGSRVNVSTLKNNEKRYLEWVKLWNSGNLIEIDEAILAFLKNDKDLELGTLKKKEAQIISSLKVKEQEIKHLLEKFKRKDILSLATKGILGLKRKVEKVVWETQNYSLTSEQNYIFLNICRKLDKKDFSLHLIHGVTGSGKTIIYFELIKKCLENKQSILFLVPEIAIGISIFQRLSRYIKYPYLFFYNGAKSDVEKKEIFQKVLNNVSVVVGTRSSVFLPFKNLGLIIVDEEHVESYKQDQGAFLYQAKEVAYFLAKKNKLPLVLGSATPDIKTFYAFKNTDSNIHILTSRYGDSVSPEIKIVKIDKSRKNIFSDYTWSKIKEYIEKKEKVIVLHNKRGYAHILYCNQCGEIAKCNNCDVSLTYYKQKDLGICHYCGFSLKLPLVCNKCLSSSFKLYSEGTEKIEEILQKGLNTDILRLDRDVVKNESDLKDVLDRFERSKGSILVGTQMLGKGHDFADVQLGVVVDGDFGLSFPDYRSRERMFQLLVQLIGRVGRRDKRGEVIIQTKNPDNEFWELVQREDYLRFYEQEIDKRKIFTYPPFSKLALIRVSYPKGWDKEEIFLGELKKYSQLLAGEFSGKVLGPVPAVIGYLKKRQRYHLLLKSADWLEIRNFFGKLKVKLKKWVKSSLSLELDLDPLNIL